MSAETMDVGIDVRAVTAVPAHGVNTSSLDAAAGALDAASVQVATAGEPRELSLALGALSARLTDSGRLLGTIGRLDVLPLVHELQDTVGWLAAEGVSTDARSAVDIALGLLLEQLRDDAGKHWIAAQFAAIVNLRSVRGEALSFAVPPIADDCIPKFNRDVLADAARRLLPAFRRGLVGLLKEGVESAATVLARSCRAIGDEAVGEIYSYRWRLAAEVLDMSSESMAATLRVPVTRVAMRLEYLLRQLSAEKGGADSSEEARIWNDVEVLGSLISRTGNEPVSLPSSAPEVEACAAADFEHAIDAIRNGVPVGVGLRALRDASLHSGHYDRWFEIRELERENAGREVVLRRLAMWETQPEPEDEAELRDAVEDHLARADAAPGKRDGNAMGAYVSPEPALTGEAKISLGRGDVAPSLVTVDEALLEDLNLAAGEIRGARSRAEASLGSLRGGLRDMEDTIKGLRRQLEILELDVSTEVRPEFPAAKRHDEAPAKLGALSRGIEELQRLQDALHVLTEDTETALAFQASEDSELEHGLLKTRLVSVRTQFERWITAVTDVGAEARLDIAGGDAMLERREAAALSNALIPLLEVCVADTGADHITMDISRPSFDLLLELRFSGGPVKEEAWHACSAAFEDLGAFAMQHQETSDTTIRIVVPSPPQSMDVILVELGGQQFALPVDGVEGMVRGPKGNATGEALQTVAEAESHSLAALLDLEEPTASGPGAADHVSLAAGSIRQVVCRVDAVRGRERVLARSPGPLLSNHPWIMAAIVNEHAPPTLVLDLKALVPALISEVGVDLKNRLPATARR